MICLFEFKSVGTYSNECFSSGKASMDVNKSVTSFFIELHCFIETLW